MAPEGIGFEGLSDAVGSEVGIFPAIGRIAGLLTPVAVPSGSSIVGLCGVVVAFSVTTDE